jgi:acetyl/propionyl-CoA carboxylase alpha subunit
MDEKKDFFFLEMNTRLQVEHPITEMITGVDLVKEQIEIARNKKLNIKQEDIKINGHAIELRVCAEDPYNNFLPDTGSLDVYMRPQGPGVRVDDGLRQGMDISIYYDPMIAKLIVHSFDRKSAIEKMKRAIEEYNIQGVKTTLGFGAFVLDNRHFKSGDFDTHFIEKHFDPDEATKLDKKTSEIAALASILIYNDINKPQKSIQKKSNTKQKYWLKNRKK